MNKFRHLLVGIDYSDACRSALRTAIRLATADDAAVTAVHVLDPRLAKAMQEVHGFTEAQLLRNVEDSVHRFLAESEFGSEMVRIHLDIDHPITGLTSACRKTQADLLVLGTRGTSHGPNEVGAVASKCVRRAPTDVLLVREDMSGPFVNALVGVDFSEASGRAVSMAGHIASCDGTKLDCIHVYEPPVVLDYGGFLPAIPLDEPGIIDGLNKDLQELVPTLLQPYPSVKWHAEVQHGTNTRDVLIHHAKKTDSDLVVIGTRGKSDLHTLFMGTTAESIVRRAACSVLAVKPSHSVIAAA
ncbi:universal stress protein [Phragmitibacter flavus]|uniref:Universal stress protein n=1 Tax=Phragmitibacter flavus TaxID=2576071 RepID=A0A5R8KB01_9BACT|nr:universal stress protein [Phragmitibacter flavus]TLD69095.1 universal stress protein [Phragmitibacter flavus]